MAQSKTDIVNSGLIKIGAEPILSLNDDKKSARLAKNRYDPARRAVLRLHPWNCAVKRETLAPLTEEPDFGFTHQHQLPADCLRVLAVNWDDSPEYRIEGRKLLIDSDTVELKYIFDLEDTAEMDSLLAEAIGAYLATDIVYALTQKSSMTDMAQKIFDKILRKARTVDSQENSYQEMEANLWDDSRGSTQVGRSNR